MNKINDATPGTTVQSAATPLTRPSNGVTDGAASNTSTAGASNTVAAPASSTVTTISTISTQLQAAQAATSSAAVFSSAKVNEIKQAIAEGRFEVNTENVAKGLLEGMSGLFSAHQ